MSTTTVSLLFIPESTTSPPPATERLMWLRENWPVCISSWRQPLVCLDLCVKPATGDNNKVRIRTRKGLRVVKTSCGPEGYNADMAKYSHAPFFPHSTSVHHILSIFVQWIPYWMRAWFISPFDFSGWFIKFGLKWLHCGTELTAVSSPPQKKKQKLYLSDYQAKKFSKWIFFGSLESFSIFISTECVRSNDHYLF